MLMYTTAPPRTRSSRGVDAWFTVERAGDEHTGRDQIAVDGEIAEIVDRVRVPLPARLASWTTIATTVRPAKIRGTRPRPTRGSLAQRTPGPAALTPDHTSAKASRTLRPRRPEAARRWHPRPRAPQGARSTPPRHIPPQATSRCRWGRRRWPARPPSGVPEARTDDLARHRLADLGIEDLDELRVRAGDASVTGELPGHQGGGAIHLDGILDDARRFCPSRVRAAVRGQGRPGTARH